MNDKNIDDFNLIIFDMNGVLRTSNEPIEIAKNTFNILANKQIPMYNYK